MPLTTLYTPDGQPWQVPLADVPNRLAQGFRREPINRPQPPALAADEETTEEPDRTPPPPPPAGLTRINHDSLSKIVKLPNVGTATAKAVVANRPYTCIEDLIERVPFPREGLSWMAVETLITFD